MPKVFFVYGTLKRGRGNHRILSNATYIGNGITELDGFFMYTNGGFPYVLTGGKFRVSGELFEVSDQDTENRLDWLEGVPTHYVRTNVPVRVGDDIIDAEMYVASKSTADRVRNHLTPVLPNDDNLLVW